MYNGCACNKDEANGLDEFNRVRCEFAVRL
jgi:hypothetical protein